MGKPMVRASFLKRYVEHLGRSPDPDARRVLEGLGVGEREEIEEAISIGWVDLRVNLALNRGMRTHLGIDRAQELFRGLYLDLWTSRLFRTIVESATALARADPRFFLKLTPSGYPMLYRHTGRVERPRPDGDDVLLQFVELPDTVFDPEVMWAELTVASFEAVMQGGGRTVIEAVEPERHRMIFRASAPRGEA